MGSDDHAVGQELGSPLDRASPSERAAENIGQWCFAYLMWLQRPHLPGSAPARDGLIQRICAVLRERAADDDFAAYLFGCRGLGGTGPNGLAGRGARVLMKVLRADARSHAAVWSAALQDVACAAAR